MYPHSRSLIWKFGASAQFISSHYTPADILKSDRFETSDIPTKTSGLTPIVYASAQGGFGNLNTVRNELATKPYNLRRPFSQPQKHKHPMVNESHCSGDDAVWPGMNHALMVSYKRTLSDIPYTAISSVINWSDAYNYTIGNPDLKAQSADIVMADCRYYETKSTSPLFMPCRMTASTGRHCKALKIPMYSIRCH